MLGNVAGAVVGNSLGYCDSQDANVANYDVMLEEPNALWSWHLDVIHYHQWAKAGRRLHCCADVALRWPCDYPCCAIGPRFCWHNANRWHHQNHLKENGIGRILLLWCVWLLYYCYRNLEFKIT